MTFRYLFLLLVCYQPALLAAPRPTVAFWYAPDPPLHLLRHFDRLVVEPENLPASSLTEFHRAEQTLLAYVSVGEVHAERPWFPELDSHWFLGNNPDWGGTIMDVANPAWRQWLFRHRFRPLWQAGYRGFFLDTLDSYHLAGLDAEALARQRTGLVELISQLRREFPSAQILINRGFEVLPRIASLIDGLAAESLFAGWDATNERYEPVAETDRQWLLARLRTIRADHPDLDIVVLDYVSPGDREQARDVARRIHALGFTPWVSSIGQDTMGLGAVEVLPREILMLYDSRQTPQGVLAYADIHRLAAMPVEYLGYVPVYHDLARGLPEGSMRGRYAAVIAWLGARTATAGYAAWLLARQREGVPFLLLGNPGFDLDPDILAPMGLKAIIPDSAGPWRPVKRATWLGLEAPLTPRLERVSGVLPLAGHDGNRVHLLVRDEQGHELATVVTGSWGGLALSPWVVDTDIDNRNRWLLDPFALIEEALRLPELPMPDVTTLNGRRLWMNHIDGDAFVSRAEIPGRPRAPETILKRILSRYRVPHTVSIVEGEIGPEGLYPDESQALERLARRIFALPHVEAASHGFSHPFEWGRFREGRPAGDGVTLPIPGYRLSLRRELIGSLDYVNRLLPTGKRARLFLWTGDCLPPEPAVALLDEAGYLNMNGGETEIRKNLPLLAAVSPMARPLGRHLQVYAPMANDNHYTRGWQGPYWGFRRVVETFELTDRPRRLKPIDIYYHFYSGTKAASLRALEDVYAWVAKQETTPVFVSEYVPLVKEFRRISLARRLDGRLQYRGIRQLRSLRLLKGGIDRDRSQGLAGMRRLHDGLYLHLSGPHPLLQPADTERGSHPYLLQANGHLQRWEREEDGRIRVRLNGHVPLRIVVAGVSQACQLVAERKRLATATARDGQATFQLRRRHFDGALECR